MTIQFCSLGSGSGGNAYWVGGGGVELLVDCGFGRVQTLSRLEHAGKAVEDLCAVICTHGHSDHIQGLRPLGKSATDVNRRAYERMKHLPFWMTRRTFDFANSMVKNPDKQLAASRWCELPEQGKVRILPQAGCEGEGIEVETTGVWHDCPGTVALRITAGASVLAIATDVGKATDELAALVRGAGAMVLEFNHDPEMLTTGPYPRKLKKRIRGDYGHLSNAQAAAFLEEVAHPGLVHLCLAHISQTNNTPQIALATARDALRRLGLDTSVTALDQSMISPVLEIP